MAGFSAHAAWRWLVGCLALVSLGVTADAHAQSELEFALVVSGGLTGAVTTQTLLYDDGSVIRLGEGEAEPGPYGLVPEPNWLIARLDPASHDRLVDGLRTNLERGATCKTGPLFPDGIGASIYAVRADGSDGATVHALNLTADEPKDIPCKALLVAYENLVALGALPAEPWQPETITVTVTAPASPFIAQAEPLIWPEGWRGVDDPSTHPDSIGRPQILLDAAPGVRETLNDLILSAREQGRPVLIDGKLFGIAFAAFLVPGEELLDAAASAGQSPTIEP